MPHRRQPARHARRFEAAAVEVGEIVPQRLGFGRGEALANGAEKFGKILEVPAIGVERVGAGALFGGQHIDEQANQLGICGLGSSRFGGARLGTHSGTLAAIS